MKAGIPIMYEEQIIEKLNEVIADKQPVDDSTEEGYYHKITAPLVALEDHLREQMQAETSQQISQVISKLESDKEITDSDLNLVRLWLIGDAAAYVQMENDYRSWLRELNRLLEVIEQLKVQELTLENMYTLSGTARDAIRVIADIVFFKRQQVRINAFENASENMTSDNKLTVANILEQKLDSDQT